jgi:hypothetical protein
MAKFKVQTNDDHGNENRLFDEEVLQKNWSTIWNFHQNVRPKWKFSKKVLLANFGFKLLPSVPGCFHYFQTQLLFQCTNRKGKKGNKKTPYNKHMPFVQPLERKVVECMVGSRYIMYVLGILKSLASVTWYGSHNSTIHNYLPRLNLLYFLGHWTFGNE